jgi:hypothetical protein
MIESLTGGGRSYYRPTRSELLRRLTSVNSCPFVRKLLRTPVVSPHLVGVDMWGLEPEVSEGPRRTPHKYPVEQQTSSGLVARTAGQADAL